MGIGGSITLIAIGAILAFALTETSVGPVELNVVGWILMAAGLVGLLLTLTVFRRRRVVEERPVRREVVERDPY